MLSILAVDSGGPSLNMRPGLTGKVDGMLLDELLGLIRVETGEREHAL